MNLSFDASRINLILLYLIVSLLEWIVFLPTPGGPWLNHSFQTLCNDDDDGTGFTPEGTPD